MNDRKKRAAKAEYWKSSRKMLGFTEMERENREQAVEIRRELKGVIEPNIVRIISFIVITISLVACTVLCILAIWKFTESDAVWRAVATFIVVSIATAIFTFVNEKLG